MTNLKKIRKVTELMGFKRGRNEGNYVTYYYRYEEFEEVLCILYEFKGRMEYVGIPYKYKLVGNNEVIVRF